MIVTWEREGVRACFFGVRETATGRLRAVTLADVEAFLGAYEHRKDGRTVFDIIPSPEAP